MIEIRLHRDLAERVGSPSKIDIDGETPLACLNDLVDQYADLKKILFEPDKKINSAVLLFINNEQIHEVDLDRTLKPDDRLDIIPAIVGG